MWVADAAAAPLSIGGEWLDARYLGVVQGAFRGIGY